MMKRASFILLLLALAAGFASATLTFYAARSYRRQAEVPVALPGLEDLENPLDLGDVPQDVLDGTFTLTNRAEKPVKIVQIVQSCRCTEIEIPESEIAPGEKISVTFKWDTSGVRGIRGSSFKVFYATEGQNGIRPLELYVQGNIVPKYDLVPEKLEFQDGKSETKTVKLVPRDGNSAIVPNTIIEDVSNSLAAFKAVKLSDREFSVTFLPENWNDDPERVPYIAVKTNCEKERRCDVTIRVQK